MRQNTNTIGAGTQNSCRQCGICCTKGGAALHSEDLFLLQERKILRSDCITLRKGEFAWSPVTDKVEPIRADIIKLRGTGSEWVCCYFDQKKKMCGIYENRPLACRTLKCWESGESLALAGKNLLSRESVLQDDARLFDLAMEYEEKFPLPDFTVLMQDVKNTPKECVIMLEDIMNRDLVFRDNEIQLSIKVAKEELFLFGRPLFLLLQSVGLLIVQKKDRLCLKID